MECYGIVCNALTDDSHVQSHVRLLMCSGICVYKELCSSPMPHLLLTSYRRVH